MTRNGDRLLKILQKATFPVDMRILEEKTKMREPEIKLRMDVLAKQGYDIKEIIAGDRKIYTLVRFHDVSVDLYRILGKIKTPVLLTSDFHIGSHGFSEIAYAELLNDIDDYNVKDVSIVGDVIQGRGVHRLELQDLITVNITDQITNAVDYLRQIPKHVQVHMISGTHEEKVKGSIHVGLDCLKIVAMNEPNFHYYGHVVKLQLNDDYTYLGMHGSGAVTMSATRRIESVWRELEEKPNIFHMGHSHQSAYVMKGRSKYCIISGTLQRTNAWLIQKGWNAKIAWWILDDISEGYIDLVHRSPEEYY